MPDAITYRMEARIIEETDDLPPGIAVRMAVRASLLAALHGEQNIRTLDRLRLERLTINRTRTHEQSGA